MIFTKPESGEGWGFDFGKRFPTDVAQLVEECARQGMSVSPVDAALAYAEYSEEWWAASWLVLGALEPIEEAVRSMRQYLTPVSSSPLTEGSET